MKKVLFGAILGFVLSLSVSAFANSNGVLAKFTDFNFIINGKPVKMESQSLVYNGQSFLPVREISNKLGFNVTYKADSRTIELNNGSTNTTTQPTTNTPTNNTNSITNKEMAKMVVETLNLTSSKEYYLQNVKSDDEYYPYINTFIQSQHAQNPDTHFHPDHTVLKAYFFLYMSGIINKFESEETKIPSFLVNETLWIKGSTSALIEAGIVKENEAKDLLKPITKEEITMYLERAKSYMNK